MKDKSTNPDMSEALYKAQLTEQLKVLTEVASVSGSESACANFLVDKLRKHANDVYIDPVGNVIARKGTPTTYIFVHMDTIGFLVSSKSEKGVRAVSVKEKGGRPTDTPWAVSILTKSDSIDAEVYKADEKGSLAINLPDDQLKKVNLADPISLVPNLQALDQNTVASQGLDDKLGILAALEVFKNSQNIGFVATVQEETTGRGALKAVWDLKPEAVIVLDATYDESEQGILGPTIGNGPSICLKDSLFPDRQLTQELLDAGEIGNVPLQFEVLESGSSDANRVHAAWGYTPFIFVGIPIKNMHSPNEVGDIRDVIATTKLLTEFFKSKNV